MTNTVDAYLDRMFDLLSGTGARGRRALMEIEAHLSEAVNEAGAAGMPKEEAECVAIRRFGPPETVARGYLRISAMPVFAALGRVFAAAWLMTAIAGVAIGFMGFINGVLARFAGPAFITDDGPDVAYTAERCRDLGVFNGDMPACHLASMKHHVQELVDRPLAIGALGLLLLLAFIIARQIRPLRGVTTLPNAAMVSTAGAVSFGGVGALLFGYALIGMAIGERTEVGAHLAAGIAGIAAGLVFLPQAWRQLSVRHA